MTVGAWYLAAIINALSVCGVNSSGEAPAASCSCTNRASSRLAAIDMGAQPEYISPPCTKSMPVPARIVASLKRPAAPALRSDRTTSACPHFIAMSSAVQPSPFSMSERTPAASRPSTSSSRPTRAAWSNAVLPALSCASSSWLAGNIAARTAGSSASAASISAVTPA